MYRIGIVAGESSGDILGAGLIRSMRRQVPDIEVEGIGGPLMEKEGCNILYPAEKLSVMGLVEVLGKYRELAKIRKQLIQHYLKNPPDAFIGVDAPDFNLDIEVTLRKQGIKTIHYVSPQVWAWREYRLKKIARAVDKILVLLPFEKAYYKQHEITADYVGHPAADTIRDAPDIEAARNRLGLPLDKKIIAVMPGSRKMEQDMLTDIFLDTCRWCFRKDDGIYFVTSLLNDSAIDTFNQRLSDSAYSTLPFNVYKNRSADVLEACDVALLASGTITLEAMLHKKPMVVAYKMKPLTFKLLKLFVKVNYAALPNLLTDNETVPECLQEDCHPEKMGPLLIEMLSSGNEIKAVKETFSQIHKVLKLQADEMAANSVLNLLMGK